MGAGGGRGLRGDFGGGGEEWVSHEGLCTRVRTRPCTRICTRVHSRFQGVEWELVGGGGGWAWRMVFEGWHEALHKGSQGRGEGGLCKGTGMRDLFKDAHEGLGGLGRGFGGFCGEMEEEGGVTGVAGGGSYEDSHKDLNESW